MFGTEPTWFIFQLITSTSTTTPVEIPITEDEK
jgi:hypothetical protein